MSSNTWVNIGVGILFAVAVVASGGGATAALFAFSLGATASALVMGPDKQNQPGGLRPDELQINQSAEDATIPVIFGTSRVPANYIYVGFDQFEAIPIYAQAAGGKGGADPQQTGFRYRFPLAYGVCMGEIDALIRVLGSPGLDVMFESADDGLEFTGGMQETIEVKFSQTSGDQTFTEGGHAEFYPGSFTQGTDGITVDANHRGVCWISFANYGVDGSPSPRSLLFEIRRMPVVEDDDGNPISSFPVRASTVDTVDEWNDANPAAVAWEVLQNKVWGAAKPSDQLHVQSFRDAADYYQRSRLGLSTAMGAQSLSSFMGKLRDVFGLWIWWDGQQLRARCIYDRDTAYSPRPRIQADDVIGSPTINRPSLAGTYNEIRLEFTNRQNNWQQEVATAMDLAHVETVGGVRSTSVDGAEIGTRRAAELICHSMLRQMAYPSATAVVNLRRTYSGLQPGGFIEFLWDEWREGGMCTTFWRVVDVEDDDQSAEGITVTLVEDLYATAIDGELADGDFTAPVPTIDQDIPLVNDDLVDGDLTGVREPGSLRPVKLWEPNSYASGGNRVIMVAPTREKGYVQSVTLAWRNFGESGTTPLGASAALPYNGKLLTPLSSAGPKISRSYAGEFQVELYYPSNAPRFEAATGLVQADSDHFGALTAKLDAVMLIGNEIFRVGFAEETSPGIMTIRTYMRGELGSTIDDHLLNEQVCFFPSFNPNLFKDARGIPTENKVVVHLTANTINSRTDYDTTSDQAPADGLGIQFDGRSMAPFAPELVSASKIGTTWTVKVRPRVWFGGAGYRSAIEDDFYNLVTDLTGLSIRVGKTAGGDLVTVPAGISYATPPFTMPASTSIDQLTWNPDDGSITGGIITLKVTFDANPAQLLIWGVRNGYESVTPLTVPQP